MLRFSCTFVDSFWNWVPIKKTIEGKLHKCQTLHLGITIRLIDRLQGLWNEIRMTNLGKITFEVNFGTY